MDADGPSLIVNGMPSMAPSSTAQPNGIAESNGVSHGEDRTEPQPALSIQEGKQKAKEVMAAAQIAVVSRRNSLNLPGKVTKSDEQRPMTNGLSPGRKRSRSGTPITHVEVPNIQAVEQRQHDELLETYQDKDAAHHAALSYDTFEHVKLVKRVRDELEHYNSDGGKGYNRRAHIKENFGPGYLGFGNGITHYENPRDGHFRLVYPKDRRRPGHTRTRDLTIKRKEMSMQSEQNDELVPIRLDVEWDKYRLRDTFTWNLHDRVISPELFAEQMIEDFKLPPEHGHHLVRLVATAIRDQVQEYHPQISFKEEALDPHLPYSAYKDDEMRISIKLNITIGQNCLEDQFEWDLNNPENSPEEFARKMTTELCLSGEFATAIAHSIREQCQLFTRSLYVTNHPFDGRVIEDAELRSCFLPSPMPASFRPYQQAKEFTPYYFPLDDAELEKTELSLSREERRQKRTNRRGGPALPDLKDRRRTIRTLVTSAVLPDSARNFNESRIFKFIATATNRGRKAGYARDGLGDDSSESESEISESDSVAIPQHLLQGTARTRNMRGAATAAQAAMRGQGRADTPDFMLRDEVRTSGRRAAAGGRDYREDSSVDDNFPVSTLIVRLKIHPARLRALMREMRNRPRPDSLLAATLNTRRSHSGTPGLGTPRLAASRMGPPTTPGRQGSTASAQATPAPAPAPAGGGTNPLHPHAAQMGRVDALGPPGPEFPPVRHLFSLALLFPPISRHPSPLSLLPSHHEKRHPR